MTVDHSNHVAKELTQQRITSLVAAVGEVRATAATSEVIPRGKSGSPRIRTQNSCVTVDNSNHVAKELTQQRGR